jgi:hypothetical protein
VLAPGWYISLGLGFTAPPGRDIRPIPSPSNVVSVVHEPQCIVLVSFRADIHKRLSVTDDEFFTVSPRLSPSAYLCTSPGRKKQSPECQPMAKMAAKYKENKLGPRLLREFPGN